MKQQAYQIERDRRVLVARPARAECTGSDLADLTAELVRRIGSGEADSVVVELSNVRHMDSCCVGRLLVLRQHALAQGGSVALACCQPNVRFLFNMTKLDRMLGLYETTELAVAELRSRRTRPGPQPAREHAGQTPADRPVRGPGYAPMLTALLRAHKRLHAKKQPEPVDLPDPGSRAR